MGGVAMIVIWVLVYFISSRRPAKSEGDNTPSELAHIFLVIIIVVMVTSFSAATHWAISIVFSVIAFALIFPFIPINILVFFNQTKLAYHLGGLSLIRFNRNVRSAKLYYGFLASVNISDPHQRRENLEWLRTKFIQQTKPLFSGDIVMFTIIDAYLRAPNKLQQKLKHLNGLPTASIPKDISKLAYRYALAFELPNNNLNNVLKISRQWDTKANNHLAKYIISSCDVITNPFAKDDWRLKLRSLFSFAPIEIKYWFNTIREQQASTQSIDELNHTQKIRNLMLLGVNKNSSDSTRTNALLKQLANSQSKQAWQERARELGVWQVDELWVEIENRLNGFESSENQSALIADEQRYQELENHHKALKYLERSIESRVEPEITGATSQHLIDWLKVLEIMSELEIDNSSELTAFSNIHNTLWNWIAALWNHKDERRLAIHIATWCIPRAQKCGFNDFLETLYFVTGDVHNMKK